MSYLKKLSSHHEVGCIFCGKRDADDDAKAHVLFRGERVYVTLNLFPYSNGHLMVVPNEHVSSLEDLAEPTLVEFMRLTQWCVTLLREASNPDGFNIGINIGLAAGAGVAGHLHQHIVPRWGGDTNFMTALGQTRVIPEWIDETYDELRALWEEKFPQSGGK